MLKLNRKMEYALMALQCLGQAFENAAEQTDLVRKSNLTAKEIADMIGAPFEVAARVLQVLAQHDWVSVELGAKGGYKLQKQLNEMTMKDLIEIIEGPVALVKCQHSESACDIQNQCKIVSPMQQLNVQLTQFYSQIHLHELLGGKHV